MAGGDSEPLARMCLSRRTAPRISVDQPAWVARKCRAVENQRRKVANLQEQVNYLEEAMIAQTGPGYVVLPDVARVIARPARSTTRRTVLWNEREWTDFTEDDFRRVPGGWGHRNP